MGEATIVQLDVVKLFEKGTIVSSNKVIAARSLPWVDHPEFKGVYIKDLVTSADTSGAFSCHLVKVNGGCAVEAHAHANEWEFNEVLSGNGVIVIADQLYPCKAGLSCINPPGISHIVTAGDQDLYLLAKFVPALR